MRRLTAAAAVTRKNKKNQLICTCTFAVTTLHHMICAALYVAFHVNGKKKTYKLTRLKVLYLF